MMKLKVKFNFQGHRLIKENVWHHDISTFTISTTYILMPATHMMKPKVQVQRWVTLTYFSMSQRVIKEKCCHHDIFTPIFCITFILLPLTHMMKLKSKMGDLDLFFNVTEANKVKSLSSRYLHTYNFHYFHINTCDPYDETKGQVQRWVTLTNFLRSQRLIKYKFVITISPHLQFVLHVQY